MVEEKEKDEEKVFKKIVYLQLLVMLAQVLNFQAAKIFPATAPKMFISLFSILNYRVCFSALKRKSLSEQQFTRKYEIESTGKFVSTVNVVNKIILKK